MQTIKATGEQVTETREELAVKYFGPLSSVGGGYAKGNMGIISLLSDLQERLGMGGTLSERESKNYRILLNDIKCILIEDHNK